MNRASLSATVLIAFVILFSISGIAQSTIHVPADQPTIQGAIAAAVNGDTVLVSPGTYHEHLDFAGKSITVVSANGPSLTTIDGDLSAPVVYFHTSETAAAVLQGFTLTHGKASSPRNAGGIEIQNASPTIAGNVIKDNQGCNTGGIYSSGGSPIIRNNTISNNRQSGCSGGTGGGGIALHSSGNAQVIGNTITGNYNTSIGGGMSIGYSGSPLIQNNVISKNTAYNGGGGIYIFNGAMPLMIQNLIAENTPGGVYWGAPSGKTNAIVLLNNTIVNNDRVDGSALFASGWTAQRP